MQQQKNYLLFFTLSLLLILGWLELRQRLFPPPKMPAPPALAEKEPGQPEPEARPVTALELALGLPSSLYKPTRPVAPPAPAPLVEVAEPTPPDKLIALGEEARGSRFHLKVRLDPRGAGVRQVILNKFQEEDEDGRPVWNDPKDKKDPRPFELIPDAANRLRPSFLLYHFDPRDPNEDRPLDTLGRVEWKQDGGVKEEARDGKRTQSVTFRAEIEGVEITKTFSLAEGEYHLGLEVQLRRLPGRGDERELKFHYQMTGGHGLPVEGRWFTNTFRNALIERVDRGKDTDWQYHSASRDLQDLRQLSLWEGGNEVRREENWIIRYAGVVTQYFSSVLVVDDQQQRQDFLLKARPTLEVELTRGTFKSLTPDRNGFILTTPESQDRTFWFDHPELRQSPLLQKGVNLGVTHFTDGHLRAVATAIEPAAQTQPLWTDDVTVRVATELVDLKPDVPVTHKYLLYNGPVKPLLLGPWTGSSQITPELTNRYVDTLHLYTLTDYHSPGAMGSFFNAIGMTTLVIKATNLMHGLLGQIHRVVWNYGLCIILLTVIVRALLFPISRKQAQTSIKMQELAPELKKLQEKFKDDRQALGVAQMELYRKHGVNPLGSCWLLLLQMPIMAGLYFALQESIQFRLAEFWPTWIVNLSAPDMLFYWGRNVPFISRIEDYGSFFYLGPYLNLLPVIAISLMMVQQKMMTPPPTDEQQEMQMKVMKYMMIFMGLMFYKVAAGLCVYFIAGSVWSFAERKLLPKKKPNVGPVSADGLFKKLLAGSAPADQPEEAGPSPVTRSPAGNGGELRGRNRNRGGRVKRKPESRPVEETPSMMRKLRDWWAEVLKQAEKK